VPAGPKSDLAEKGAGFMTYGDRRTEAGIACTLGAVCVASLLFAGPVLAQGAATGVKVDPDGTVHAPAMDVPMSVFLSPEGRAYMTEHLQQMQRPELLVQNDGVPVFMEGYLASQRKQFAFEKSDTEIAGVHVYDYAPADGIAPKNKNRVLINLHGGGFMGCFPGCAELESIPIATLGEIRVVSLDYRQGPKYRFPAASEDVAAVYRELLKTYPAENIGIYGCSAGGMLTGMAVAWFQAHDLPRPGAVGVFCAGMAMTGFGFGGDSAYLNGPYGEARLPPPAKPPAEGEARRMPPLPYLSSADPEDPLVSPAVSDAVLREFPPTLIVTGTRGFEMSSAVYTHSRLVRIGVDADLHVWEGLFHGFFYNPDVPESRDCYDVIIRFFDSNLGE
jgi:acetyl esterase/lipase